MEITVNRYFSNNFETLSTVYVDGEKVCFGLEDEFREVKVMSETRIPAGKYKVGVRQFGEHHEKYKKRFPAWHKGMLEIKDVPNFKNILIHIGNTEKDTAGCLLVGKNVSENNKRFSVLNSAIAYEKLYKKVISEAEKGNLTIEYIDSDRAVK